MIISQATTLSVSTNALPAAKPLIRKKLPCIPVKWSAGEFLEAGEKILTQLLNRFVIIRSSWIYGIGRDFVENMPMAPETQFPY